MSHADAVKRDEAEYEPFAARRRALLEAEAEQAQQQTLEDAAKSLPEPPMPKNKKSKKSP